MVMVELEMDWANFNAMSGLSCMREWEKAMVARFGPPQTQDTEFVKSDASPSGRIVCLRYEWLHLATQQALEVPLFSQRLLNKFVHVHAAKLNRSLF